MSETERRLTHCARCGEKADGPDDHALYGVICDDLGEFPVVKLLRALQRTNTLLIRLRLCAACHAEALAFAAAPQEARKA